MKEAKSPVGTSETAFEDPWALDALSAQGRALTTGDTAGWINVFQRFTACPHRELTDLGADLMRRVREMALCTLGEHALGEADHWVPVTDTWERASGIAAPVCAINGALDAPDRLAMADPLAKLVPSRQTATVSAAAH
ncbi:alpha/beta fold hydrolase [Streptomyces sp. NPDC059802]|uniref:alpha/beta fold hydrolase n=1 Tax=Streptomyces sp. NPDC059802 TaxID=3346952 RepID=UPI0036610471